MWNDGYITEIGYTYGYYRELNPAHLSFAMLLSGYDAPNLEALTYLELGSGQGVSVNIHAAANSGTFWGTDFNPEHAIFANQLGEASGADVTALDAAFDELAARDDLPEFDMIVLHGIWSWISDENRAVIVDIARRKLKPGGLFYVSYNTAPGWSAAMPLRHLMKEFAETSGTGSLTEKVDQSLDFVQSVVDADARYFKANPLVASRAKGLKENNKAYLAHEYLNSNWNVIPFSEVAQALSKAKLSFASPSNILDLVDMINLKPEAQKVLKGISDPNFFQTVRDYFVNQQFRRDIFVKGARKLSKLDVMKRLYTLPFVLLRQPNFEGSKVQGALGDAQLSAEIYGPVLKVLAADDFRPKSINDLGEYAHTSQISQEQVLQALTVLCGMEAVAPSVGAKWTESVSKSALALNNHLCSDAEYSTNVPVLAAPAIGGGVTVNQFEKLFIRGLESSRKDIPDWVWSLIRSQGQRLRKDDSAIMDDDESLAQTRLRFEEFCTNRLPILRQIGVTNARVE